MIWPTHSYTPSVIRGGCEESSSNTNSSACWRFARCFKAQDSEAVLRAARAMSTMPSTSSSGGCLPSNSTLNRNRFLSSTAVGCSSTWFHVTLESPCFQNAWKSRQGKEPLHQEAAAASGCCWSSGHAIDPVPRDRTMLGLGVDGKHSAASFKAIETGLLKSVRPPSWKVPTPSM
jgi:hypothetical protein